MSLLKSTSLFRSLAPSELERVAQRMRRVSYGPQQQIFDRGDEGTALYVVERGRVQLSIVGADGRALLFGLAGPGDVFGEIAALDGRPRTAAASAMGPVVALSLSRPDLIRLIETMPSLAIAVIAFLCDRLRATSDRLEEVALDRVNIRVAKYLLQKATSALRGAGAVRVVVTLEISQGALANRLGTTRQTINRAFRSLREHGAIEEASGPGLSLNIQKLEELASSSQ